MLFPYQPNLNYTVYEVTVRALSSLQVHSRLVRDSLEAVEELDRGNRLILTWVPGHRGSGGYEEANYLVQKGASKWPYKGIH